MRRAGLRSLSVRFPPRARTNDFWLDNHPEIVADASKRALGRVWLREEDCREPSLFESEMQPYAHDPFLGTTQRRVLNPGESALSLEEPAAREAMELAGLAPSDVDLLISSAFPADELGIGNAVFLARALGLEGAAWNLETACSSGLVALQTAAALVESGRHDHVLVVVSCTYSRVNDERSTMSFNVGDGAAAFVIGPVGEPFGVLATASVNTAETADALRFVYEDDGNEAALRMHAVRGAGPQLRDSTERCVPLLVHRVLEKSNLGLDDIDLFVCNTPTAWYSSFFARAIGVAHDRVMDVHDESGNTGPVLWPSSLHRAAIRGKLEPGSIVLLFSIGSVSSAAAAILVWGEVPIGEPPPAAVAIQ